MKKNIIYIFLFSITISLFGKSFISDSTLSYRAALNYYQNKEYGKALHSAEEAITKRRLQINKEIDTIQNSLASREFKKAGDSIDAILIVLEERDDYDCIDIINYYLNKKGRNYFNNSIENLKNYIITLENYPEACKLIGDIYKIEGEYKMSEEYYLKALENSDILDVKLEMYNLLYTLADLSYLQEDFEKMEVRLLNIVGLNKSLNYDSLNRAIKNTISKNNLESLNKFFQLYRADDYFALSAYTQLAEYYLSIEEYEKAFQFSSLSVIIGFTRISSILEKRDLDYSFTSLNDFFERVVNHSDIIQWGIDNKVWENYNLFCEICNKCGYDVFSFELLKILAKSSPQKYWQEDAVLKLDFIDGIKNPEN